MIWFDARTDVHRHAQGFVNALSKTIWLVIGALVPAVVTAFVKAVQDRSRSQRAQQLTDRISTLAKSIADVPDVNIEGTAPVTPRQALSAELNLVLAELYLLQTKVTHNFHWVSMSALTRFRSALLLFRPRGIKALVLHTAFYVYTAVFVFCAIAVVVPQSASTSQDPSVATTAPEASATLDTSAAPAPDATEARHGAASGPARNRRPRAEEPSQNQPFLSTTSWGDFFSDLAAYVFMVALASVPLLVFRYYAVKIHRQQTQTLGTRTSTAPIAPAAAAASD